LGQVVLIDMKLPDSGGSIVFDHVRQANPQARTVLITGYRAELEPVLARLMDAGADALCCKPFDVEHMFTTIDRLLESNGRAAGSPKSGSAARHFFSVQADGAHDESR
jgi:DNA-binding NtrC family response regulator